MADRAPPIRLVIFDFDGTLSDSGGWFLSVMDHLADRYGFRRVHPDEVETLRRLPTRDVISRLAVPRWKLPLIARHTRKLFARHTDAVQLFPGVTEMLAAIHDAGVCTALVTSNSKANARAVLGEANAARIDHWACGASLFGKAPRFRQVLKASSVSPAHALSVGDETRDIDAARETGVRAGAVLWGYADPSALAHLMPDIAFDTPAAVAAHVVASAEMHR